MRKIKIALVLIPFEKRVFDTISIPLGLAWLNSYLKKEHNDNIQIENYDLLLEPELEIELFSKIEKNFYDFVGIQAHSNVTVHETIRIAKYIRENSFSTKIAIGGNSATFLPEYFIDNNCVDFVILNEGELSFSKLIKKQIEEINDYEDIPGILYKNSENQFIKTSESVFIENLDDIPLPDRDAFNWRKYPQWSIITSRGCPYSCIYCSSTSFWKNKIRFRSAENVFQELILLKEKYEIDRFYFLDDTFGSNVENTQKLLNLMIESSYKYKWACLTRGDVVNKELLLLFKRAGCIEIHYGLESSNENTQKTIKKKLSMKKLSQAITWTKELDIPVKLSVIIGLPGESKEDVIETINFTLQHEPDEVQFYPMTTYIGTDVQNNLEKYKVNIIHHELSKWIKDAENPQMQTDLLAKNDIIELCNLAVKKFKELGYSWIPHDIPAEKRGRKKIIKTVFAPIQGLEKINT